MKVGLKISMVVFPIPTVYWVITEEHPKWVKAISVLWAILTAFLMIGASQSGNGYEAYSSFIFSSLVLFGILNGIVLLFRKVIDKSKQQK